MIGGDYYYVLAIRGRRMSNTKDSSRMAIDDDDGIWNRWKRPIINHLRLLRTCDELRDSHGKFVVLDLPSSIISFLFGAILIL